MTVYTIDDMDAAVDAIRVAVTDGVWDTAIHLYMSWILSTFGEGD